MSAVPKLRFPSYPIHNFPDWAPLNLYEVASFFSGGTPKSTDHAYYGGQIPFIKSGEIKSITTSQTLSELGLKSSSAKKVSRGDLLYALYGATSGEVAISKIDGAINQAVLCIRTQLDTYFLYSWLLREKQNILDTYLQGGQGNLSAQIVKNFKIFAPSLPEQQKIASFLTSVDKKIDLLRQKKDALELYKKGLMQKIFSQEIRFKQDDGSDFPDWKEVALGDVFEEIKDKVGDMKIPTYSISAGVGFVSQEEKFGKDISGRQNEKYIVLGVGDFSYNKGNSKTYTYGCIYPNDEGTAIAVPNVFISFRRKSAAMSVGFFAKLFEGHYLDKGLRKLISSGARMDGLLNVNKKDFFDLQVPYPNENEQKKIASFLSAIDAKIQNTSSQIEQMETFKKGLLQQMFV